MSPVMRMREGQCILDHVVCAPEALGGESGSKGE